MIYKKDHTGMEFKSQSKMCEYWGINSATFSDRMKAGHTLEKALTTPLRNFSCKDHTGKVFKSKTKMCEYWGIYDDLFDIRMKTGYTLEEALTTPIRDRHSCEDPLGNKFKTKNDMCEYWGVSYKNFIQRISRGCNLARSLGISFIFHKNTNIFHNKKEYSKYNLTIEKRTEKGRDVFECWIDNEDGSKVFRIMDHDEIDEYCIEQCKKMYRVV